MINFEAAAPGPSAQVLVENNVASRIRKKDSLLYNFSENAQLFARDFMGWTTLASQPPTPLDEIQNFADALIARGLRTVVLVGQGGSTQAPMTLTKYNKVDSSLISFKTIDSVSPVRVRAILSECDPKKTLVIHSSKSGGTIEPHTIMEAVIAILREELSEEEVYNHLVAVTDPGSDLEKRAKEEGWLRVFSGEPSVGGRYSALSVFGLLPAALVGINLNALIKSAAQAEEICSADTPENPALILASFLYDNYTNGRDKFTFLSPKRGRVLGLWIEQLVAESLGKEGQGILPNIETDSLTLSEDAGDRSVIIYETKTDLLDESMNYFQSLEYLHKDIPKLTYKVENVIDLAGHFVMWEYAIAMVGYLMKVCPFDQPDVQVAKTEVLHILAEGGATPNFIQNGISDVPVGEIEVYVSEALAQSLQEETVDGAFDSLCQSVAAGDYFSLNAFLPFTGEGRREALEEIRHCFAEKFGVPSCLEIGPRYLHSTGQLHKGGKNNGVFLILSADEPRDIPVENARAKSLGELEKAQAMGDFAILSSRGRRCVHIHLPNNSAVTLRLLAKSLRHAADRTVE
jgi:glucose-6-phosphate isomerase